MPLLFGAGHLHRHPNGLCDNHIVQTRNRTPPTTQPVISASISSSRSDLACEGGGWPLALSGNRNENGKLPDFVLCDVTPLSLGIVNGKEGSMGVFILRNSGTPITVNRTSTTTFDNQCSGRVVIYEANNNMDSDEIYDAAGVVIGVLAIIFLIVLISCCNRRQSPVDPSDHTESSATIEQGLDEATICSYPKLLYSEAKLRMFGSVSAPSCCCICLADFEDKDVLRSVPNCGHFFHQICVDKWLQLHPTCPICRNSPLDPSAVLVNSVEVVEV
ncbi:hypothetical protein L3X38_009623 [Prunus dulcis]|uniref:RING-type domain-containing protein n=2 Tax=Prunus dulcis TaxID=3755 RepID=A0AAD4WE09_PRUDU|nr:hypothetical protein L3X38_009623 [Prunus dulcis]